MENCRIHQRIRRGWRPGILYFAAVFVLAGSEKLAGTCTVAIAAPDFGILAADCNEARQDGSSFSAACKIRTSNGLAVTLAGMVFDGNTGLDLVNVAMTAMAKSDSPREAADQFAALAMPEIARSLERQSTEAWEMWHKRHRGCLPELFSLEWKGARWQSSSRESECPLMGGLRISAQS